MEFKWMKVTFFLLLCLLCIYAEEAEDDARQRHLDPEAHPGSVEVDISNKTKYTYEIDDSNDTTKDWIVYSGEGEDKSYDPNLTLDLSYLQSNLSKGDYATRRPERKGGKRKNGTKIKPTTTTTETASTRKESKDVHNWENYNTVPTHDLVQKPQTESPEDKQLRDLHRLYFLMADNIRDFPVDLQEILHQQSTTDSCFKESMYLFRYLLLKNPTIVHYADSIPKLDSGVMKGNLFWPGSYDQCIDHKVKILPGTGYPNTTDFYNKYCLVDVYLNDSEVIEKYMSALLNKQTYQLYRRYPIRIGVCAPISCPHEDVENSLKILINHPEHYEWLLTNQTNFTVNAKTCQTKDRRQFPLATYITIGCVGFFALLVLIGTFIDYADVDRKYSKILRPPSWLHPLSQRIFLRATRCREFIRFLVSFSLIHNVYHFVDIDHESPFKLMDALLVWNVIWLIASQTFVMSVPYFWVNLNAVAAFQKSLLYPIFVNQFQAVDTILYIRGFMAGSIRQHVEDKISVSTPKRGGSDNLPAHKLILQRISTFLILIVERYLKYTIPYAIFIVMVLAISTHVQGPMSYIFAEQAEICERHWWTNLLYVSNFVNPDKTCYQHTWFLDVNMQGYLLSVILFQMWCNCHWIYPVVIVVVVLIASIVTQISLFVKFEVTLQLFTHFGSLKNQEHYYELIFTKPFLRIYPYIFGLIFGYLFNRYQKLKGIYSTNSSKFHHFIGTHAVYRIILSTMILSPLLCGVGATLYIFHTGKYLSHLPYLEILIAIAWPFGLSWFIAYGLHNENGIVRAIVSPTIFQQLAKLTFVAYLFHYVILDMFFNSRNGPIHFDFFVLILLIIGFVFITYAVALLFHLIFEAPTQLCVTYCLRIFKKSPCLFNWFWIDVTREQLREPSMPQLPGENRQPRLPMYDSPLDLYGATRARTASQTSMDSKADDIPLTDVSLSPSKTPKDDTVGVAQGMMQELQETLQKRQGASSLSPAGPSGLIKHKTLVEESDSDSVQS